MKVELSKRAQRAVTRIDARWRKHADHPELFLEEMLEVVEHLETVSNPGTPCPTKRRPQLKRMLLEKTKCHLYFVSDEGKQRIDVLHVWDGRRERLPTL